MKLCVRLLVVVVLFVGLVSCVRGHHNVRGNACVKLQEQIDSIIAAVDGEVGVALITSEGDTLLLNNDRHYPLMSVFKMHQALGVAYALDMNGETFDKIIEVENADMNPATWSPMLKKYPTGIISVSVAELLYYSLVQSDNNASNILFEKVAPVSLADSISHSAISCKKFNLIYTEAEMQRDHNLAYNNGSSPLACAELIHTIFTDSIVSSEKQQFIRDQLSRCETGLDRIYAPLSDKPLRRFAHKTGSGYRNDAGRLMAHNDVAFVVLPKGRWYALAVLIKDFSGSESDASSIIASISKVVYSQLNED